jgi:hypothetical protein
MEHRIRAGLMASGGAHAPNDVLQAMETYARALTRGRQEDAHEALRLTLEALQHAGLRALGLPTHGPLAAPSCRRPRTLVERVFGGTLRSTVTCGSCGAVSRTEDPFEDISLELRGADSVAAALAGFTRPERLDDANKYRCEACAQLTAAEKRITIAHAPAVLVLHLKRFSATGAKIGRPIAFPERLSLQPHMAEPAGDDGGCAYALHAVVVHSGWSVSSGHYFSYVATAAGWHLMDDSHVARVALARVLACADAYILSYRRVRDGAAESPAAAPPPLRLPAPPAAALPAARAPLAALPPAANPLADAKPAPLLALHAPPQAPASTPTGTPEAPRTGLATTAATRTTTPDSAGSPAAAAAPKRKRDVAAADVTRLAAALMRPAALGGADAESERLRVALRASPWCAFMREQLRGVKRRRRMSHEALLHDWHAAGLERASQAAVAKCAPEVCSTLIVRVCGLLRQGHADAG